MVTTQAKDLRDCVNRVLLKFEVMAGFDSLHYVTTTWKSDRRSACCRVVTAKPGLIYNLVYLHGTPGHSGCRASRQAPSSPASEPMVAGSTFVPPPGIPLDAARPGAVSA